MLIMLKFEVNDDILHIALLVRIRNRVKEKGFKIRLVKKIRFKKYLTVTGTSGFETLKLD